MLLPLGAWEGIAVVIDARARWHGRHAGGMRWLGRVASAHDDALVEPLMLEKNLLLVCATGVASRPGAWVECGVCACWR